MSEISDAALLLLIVDDDKALSVLAAWGGLRVNCADIDSENTVTALMSSTGCPRSVVISKLKILSAARVLRDGGITDLADKMLQTLVQTKLGGRRK